jgi:hypothetical protein
MDRGMMFSMMGVFLSLAAPNASAIETPRYQVERSAEWKGDAIEIRGYAPYIVAETVVEAESLKEASNQGFRRLAAYIFGENRTREKMDMTAPVGSEKMAMTAPVGTVSEGGRYTISFVMPSKYTLETLPMPIDTQITIRQIPARRVAAITFSGFWSESNFSERTEKLRSWLKSEGLEAASIPQIARYNMPLTPWFLRRNEVLVDLR